MLHFFENHSIKVPFKGKLYKINPGIVKTTQTHSKSHTLLKFISTEISREYKRRAGNGLNKINGINSHVNPSSQRRQRRRMAKQMQQLHSRVVQNFSHFLNSNLLFSAVLKIGEKRVWGKRAQNVTELPREEKWHFYRGDSEKRDIKRWGNRR